MGFRVHAYGPVVTSRLGGSRGLGVPRAPAKSEKHQARPANPTRRKGRPANRTATGMVGRPSPRSIVRPARGTPRESARNTIETSAQATTRRSIELRTGILVFRTWAGSRPHHHTPAGNP